MGFGSMTESVEASLLPASDRRTYYTLCWTAYGVRYFALDRLRGSVSPSVQTLYDASSRTYEALAL